MASSTRRSTWAGLTLWATAARCRSTCWAASDAQVHGLVGDPAGLPGGQVAADHSLPESGESVAQLDGVPEVAFAGFGAQADGGGELGDGELLDQWCAGAGDRDVGVPEGPQSQGLGVLEGLGGMHDAPPDGELEQVGLGPVGLGAAGPRSREHSGRRVRQPVRLRVVGGGGHGSIPAATTDIGTLAEAEIPLFCRGLKKLWCSIRWSRWRSRLLVRSPGLDTGSPRGSPGSTSGGRGLDTGSPGSTSGGRGLDTGSPGSTSGGGVRHGLARLDQRRAGSRHGLARLDQRRAEVSTRRRVESMPLPWDAKLLVGIFAVSATVHLVRPETYEPLMPDFVPKHREVIYATGVAERAVRCRSATSPDAADGGLRQRGTARRRCSPAT